MGSVLLINHRISALFTLHSPYCGTLHIDAYVELHILGILRLVIYMNPATIS
jgi:hypothetical protein